MIQTKKKNIEGLDVEVTQLPAMRALEVFARLGNMISPAIPHLSGLTLESDAIPLLGALLRHVDPPVLLSLSKDVLSNTRVLVDGKMIPLSDNDLINLAFNGRLKALVQTIRFALEVNFSDFFGDGLSGPHPGTPHTESPSSSLTK